MLPFILSHFTQADKEAKEQLAKIRAAPLALVDKVRSSAARNTAGVGALLAHQSSESCRFCRLHRPR
jgi:hypothetical protein